MQPHVRICGRIVRRLLVLRAGVVSASGAERLLPRALPCSTAVPEGSLAGWVMPGVHSRTGRCERHQFAPGRPVCAARCIPLALPGKLLSSAALDPAQSSMGVTVTFGGGDDGRELTHKVRCKAGAPLKAVGLVTLPYTVHWEGDVGCGTPSSGCLPAPAPAIPTAEQLRWQDMEIGALIHFNMATTGGCSKNASAFNPTKLDTDQWVEAFEAFGAREAVLVAKHGCGFVTWPSNATMPDGSRYNYSVASSSWMRGTGDVVASFKASCLKKGLGVGYYYSLGANSYTKGLRLTAEQLEAIEMQQMTELWSGRYGNEANLTEIWFDGGIEGQSRPVNLQILHDAPFFFKMAQNLDLRCVLVSAPWVLGPKHVSNLEKRSLRHIIVFAGPESLPC